MSAIGVVNATESLIHGLAMSLAASGRPAPVGSSPRAIRAVRKLVAELEGERAARAALENENRELRAHIEKMAEVIMRIRDHVV